MLQADNLQHPSVDYHSLVLLPFNSTNLFNYKVHVVVPVNCKIECVRASSILRSTVT